jgi:ABC-type transport system involved in multi-copper enzyme maturation permease subunit
MRNSFAIAKVVLLEMYRRKEFYVLFILTIIICLIMGSINILNEEKIVGYLKELCMLMIWVSSIIIAITTAARQIPAEREQRTLLPLLAKPLSRAELIIGKFLGCWIVCGLALLCFYVFFAALAASREHQLPFLNYFQAGFLHWMELGVVVSLSLLGSLVFAAPSSNSTICFAIIAAILCVGRYLDQMATAMHEPARTIVYTLYFAMPHLEWPFELRTRTTFDWPLVPWSVIGLTALYLMAYMGFFLMAACLVFRRKPVN